MLLHPVDQATWWWGAWGLLCLAISIARREGHGIELGVAMFSTWAVSTWAYMLLGSEREFYVSTAYDAITGIGLAAWLSFFGVSRRGVWIVALFALEMAVRLPAASYGFWNETFCYAILCAIYSAQVLIGGWRGLMDTVADWCAARVHRDRAPADSA